jgi:hypothetical protein
MKITNNIHDTQILLSFLDDDIIQIFNLRKFTLQHYPRIFRKIEKVFPWIYSFYNLPKLSENKSYWRAVELQKLKLQRELLKARETNITE